MSHYLECAHCHCEFLASQRQAKRSRSSAFSGRVYCSALCQSAALSIMKRKPYPYNGVCPQCGQGFGSRQPKKYCSMACYSKSDQFRITLRENAAKGRIAHAIKVTGMPPKTAVEYECLNCGLRWFARASANRRFCSSACYRKYMAQRFDRWMANPQNIALPQSFDEFMTQEELPCLIEGCDWKGQALGNHVNFAHGITAAEFKRAAGFNLSTGLITPEVFEHFSQRPHIQNGGPLHPYTGGVPAVPAVRYYKSLEGKEHGRTARLLMGASPDLPPRICDGCGKEYCPSPLGWSSRYCSIECRSEQYKKRNAARQYPMRCSRCSKEFQGNRNQFLRSSRGLTVMCSMQCRNDANIDIALAKRGVDRKTITTLPLSAT